MGANAFETSGPAQVKGNPEIVAVQNNYYFQLLQDPSLADQRQKWIEEDPTGETPIPPEFVVHELIIWSCVFNRFETDSKLNPPNIFQ